MNSKISGSAPTPEYPRLMKSMDSELVVLFTDHDSGLVVNAGGTNNKLGAYHENWLTGRFTPFNGTVTLSND